MLSKRLLRRRAPLMIVPIVLSLVIAGSCSGGGDSSSTPPPPPPPPPPANITVSITPHLAGITVKQTLSLTATTTDTAGVNWSVTPAGGSFSPATSMSGASVTFTPASTAGAYTLTATSVTDGKTADSATVGITDLAGVFTYHNDLTRAGANTQEYALTTATVKTASFGKLFSCTVDGAVYAQPLWVANVTIGGKAHNVVFVATEHDGLFAIDADAS